MKKLSEERIAQQVADVLDGRLPRAELWSREGGSDKVYHLWISEVPGGGGFLLHYANGPRGRTPKPGIKTPQPVSRAEAQRHYDEVLRSKLVKGYKPTNDDPMTPFVAPTANARKPDSVAVMLLEPVEDPERYYNKPTWWAQPKYDGQRVVLKLTGGVARAQNRLGLDFECPKVFVKPLTAIGQDIVLDGEAVGDTYYAFDLIQLRGVDVRNQSYMARFRMLEMLFAAVGGATIKLSETAKTPEAKRAMHARITAEAGEGMVFKDADAPYEGFRSSRAVKYKFWKSATVLVIARNDTGEKLDLQGHVVPSNKPKNRRSIQAALIDGQKLVFVGDVSVPANYAMPSPGAFCEVRYLYAFKGTKKMYQPQYEGERTDVTIDACVLTQLRYKPEP